MLARETLLGALAWLAAAQMAVAATGPAAPQGQMGAMPGSPQSVGTAEVDLGESLFVDDGTFCRYVTNNGPALPNNVTSPAALGSPGTGLVVDFYNAAEWQSFRTNPGIEIGRASCRERV